MIIYTDILNGVSANNLSGFFVGWPNPPSAETHLRILESSRHIVIAIDDETRNVVGFINAISDDVLSAYIPLLEVLPQYQGRGIGSELVRRMLDILKPLYMVDLICLENVQPFYARLGMQPCTGMTVRNFDNQCGRVKP